MRRPSRYASSVEQLRSAAETDSDLAPTLLPHLAKISAGQRDRLLAMIFDRFTISGDNTRFGLINAVTSVARDTRDHDIRWRLEELGGGIAAATLPRSDDSGVAVERSFESLVG